MCVGGYKHVAFYGNMAVVVLVFAELRWRRWLCAKKSRRGTAIEKNKWQAADCRRGRERGAGGRARCVWWPRGALLGCAALKSAHLSSRQTVPRRALRRKEPRSDFFVCFLNENEFELRNELTWHVGLEADQLAGPVVALVEQNAIELGLRNVCRRTAEKYRSEPLAGESDKGAMSIGE